MSQSIDFDQARRRLAAGEGGYGAIHNSPGLELGVSDRQQPPEDDEVYVVLEGYGALEIEDETVELKRGQAVVVPAGADHRFVGHENLTVLVIFAQHVKTAS